jgi:Metallo-peptidase family M12
MGAVSFGEAKSSPIGKAAGPRPHRVALRRSQSTATTQPERSMHSTADYSGSNPSVGDKTLSSRSMSPRSRLPMVQTRCLWAPRAQRVPPRHRGADGPPVIDLIVAYTTNAKTWSGDIDSLIALAIADTNQSFVNSGISASLRLVHTVEYAYDDERPARHTLADFAGNGDGKLDTIHALREEYGGDVAVLIHSGYSGGYATLAATADTAFAVVEWRQIAGRYLFQHEVGHLVGAVHQAGCPPPVPPFAFARAFEYRSGDQLVSTIMGERCPGGKVPRRILYWSNPSLCFEGVRIGTPQKADNARLWRERAATMAAFKTPPTAKSQPTTAGPSMK